MKREEKKERKRQGRSLCMYNGWFGWRMKIGEEIKKNLSFN